MPNDFFPINAQNLPFVRAYILEQFSHRSWWPGEAPLRARAAFEALDDSTEALQQWCLDWLDGGQWRRMRVALVRAASRTPMVSV